MRPASDFRQRQAIVFRPRSHRQFTLKSTIIRPRQRPWIPISANLGGFSQQEQPMHHDNTPPDDELDDDSPTEDDLVADLIDLETQKRLWLRALIPLLQLRSRDSDPSGRVQLAFDLMHISACDRVRRLLRSDLPDDQE
jgi:hypothetical protein